MSEADLDAIERSHQRALAAARPFGRGALVGAEADRHDLLAEVRRLREDLQLAQRCIEVVRGAVEIRDRRIPEYQSRRDKAAAVLFGYDEIMRRRRGEPSMLPGTETVTEGHDDD